MDRIVSRIAIANGAYVEDVAQWLEAVNQNVDHPYDDTADECDIRELSEAYAAEVRE